MKTQAEILTELATYLGMNFTKLSKTIGMSASSLYYMSQGRYSITENFADKVCAVFPDVNRNFILTGNGKVAMKPVKREPIKQKKQYNTVQTLDIKIKKQEEQIEALINEVKELRKEVRKVIDAVKA